MKNHLFQIRENNNKNEKKENNFNNKNKNKTKHFVTFFFSVTHKFVEEKNNKEEKNKFFSIGKMVIPTKQIF